MAKRTIYCGFCGKEHREDSIILAAHQSKLSSDHRTYGSMLPKHVIKGSFMSRQPDGTSIGLEFHGVVDSITGDIKDVAGVVLEGEMHGNDGKTRVHIFLQ